MKLDVAESVELSGVLSKGKVCAVTNTAHKYLGAILMFEIFYRLEALDSFGESDKNGSSQSFTIVPQIVSVAS
jgi:hypothetical protein